jgi:hypothetical protein
MPPEMTVAEKEKLLIRITSVFCNGHLACDSYFRELRIAKSSRNCSEDTYNPPEPSAGLVKAARSSRYQDV